MGRDVGIGVTFALVVLGLSVLYFFLTNKEDPALVALEMSTPQKAVGSTPPPATHLPPAAPRTGAPVIPPPAPAANPANGTPTRPISTAGQTGFPERGTSNPSVGGGSTTPDSTTNLQRPEVTGGSAIAVKPAPTSPAPTGMAAQPNGLPTARPARPSTTGGSTDAVRPIVPAPREEPRPGVVQPDGTVKPAAPRLPQVHVVEDGESLSLIAQRYYNDSSRYAPIIKANPAIQDAHDIRIGMKLVIPDPEAAAATTPPGAATGTHAAGTGGLTAPRAPAVAATQPSRSMGQTAAKDRKPGDTPVVHSTPRYTVRSGDTLYSIARKEMGDQNRWKELHRLNRGVIGAEPSDLREGMVLRLPLPESSTSSSRPAR